MYTEMYLVYVLIQEADCIYYSLLSERKHILRDRGIQHICNGTTRRPTLIYYLQQGNVISALR